MATTVGRETFDIEKKLLSGASQFSFIQVIRLLQRATNTSDPFDLVRIRPDLAWSTPSQEIVSIEKKVSPQALYQLTVTFLELYGAGSPLPMFYTQDLFIEQIRNRAVTREFIDIFNGVLYEIFFNIWKKYNLSYRLFEISDSSLWEQLFCIAGIGNNSIRNNLAFPQTQITFSGLSSRPIRTAEGLRVILTSIFKDVSVSIEQCVIRIAPIPDSQRVSLGQQSTTLGEAMYIGNQIRDRMGSFRIHLGPITADRLNQFLPGTPAMSLINEAVRLYVNQPLQWDIEIRCWTQGMSTLCLGEHKRGFLGWNTWIFSGKAAENTVMARFKTEGI